MMYNFRKLYKSGWDKFYKENGNVYKNPHTHIIQQIVVNFKLKPNTRILDLGCGGGEVTLALQSNGCKNIHGLDPYTYKLYKNNTGITAFTYSFQDIAYSCAELSEYDVIIASFSLHLCPINLLKLTCLNLALKSRWLVIISPHKNPNIQNDFGWDLKTSFITDRVHVRVYKSQFI